MSAGKHNIIIDQGATFELTVTVKSGGTALNLSNYSGRSSIRLTQEGDVIDTFTVAVVNPASNGVLKMSLTPTETNALAAGRYLYDLEIFTGSDAIVRRLIEGHVEVKRGITR